MLNPDQLMSLVCGAAAPRAPWRAPWLWRSLTARSLPSFCPQAAIEPRLNRVFAELFTNDSGHEARGGAAAGGPGGGAVRLKALGVALRAAPAGGGFGRLPHS